MTQLLTQTLIRWRTALLAVAGLMVLLAAFLVALHWDGSDALFSTLMVGVCTLVGIGAGKNAIEHLANGSGLKGVVKTLVSDEKPGGPNGPTQPQG